MKFHWHVALEKKKKYSCSNNILAALRLGYASA